MVFLRLEAAGIAWRKFNEFLINNIVLKSKPRQLVAYSLIGFSTGFSLFTITAVWEVGNISLNRVQARKYPELYTEIVAQYDTKKEQETIMREAVEQMDKVYNLEDKKEIFRNANLKVKSLHENALSEINN